MSLAKKVNEYLDRKTLEKSDDRYRNAYEILSIKKVKGYDKLMNVKKEDIQQFTTEHHELSSLMLQLEFGIDPRIDYVCKDLGYSYPESQLFFSISKNITYCKKIEEPIEGDGFFDKMSRKLTDKLWDKALDLAKDDCDKDYIKLKRKFHSDKEFHDETLGNFYGKVLPAYEQVLKSKN